MKYVASLHGRKRPLHAPYILPEKSDEKMDILVPRMGHGEFCYLQRFFLREFPAIPRLTGDQEALHPR